VEFISRRQFRLLAIAVFRFSMEASRPLLFYSAIANPPSALS